MLCIKLSSFAASVIWLLARYAPFHSIQCKQYLRELGHQQEAVSVGLEHGITKDDRVITAYRCHPYAVMRGGTIKGVIAELLGRQDGMSHGKGGSMHIFTPSFFGGNGIVGAQVPVGAGLAFAQKYLEKPNATFALYGDGASNQGQVFEAFNMVSNFFNLSFRCLQDTIWCCY
jgi:TPP-dependent pyruvate/acetoin dehydrogenase alpha subunit